ncbi:uncharacterized protein PV06_01907 [Exophiala oligosperma]|uniref:Mitochondrial import inner membrane translocase subunit TIM50 n=1 Tax=Exophiala oligosperma TaxID=215243 RepID=A0A0D2EE77_9EURO|nr:uncharacterized protein PV06_01907 [Exophiala oligosperma]KIW46224.1 hypothetical protein PV06_01907 [Exophiala oligosperma]
MLSRAVLPLLRPRQCRPLIAHALSPARAYSRSQGIKGPDYKHPTNSQPDASKEPLRKVPLSPANPAAQDDQPPETPPFGVDPARDLDDVSGSVSRATRRSMRDRQRQNAAAGETQSEQETTDAQAESEPQSQQPLPDLRQGIPSTLDAELGRAGQSQQPHARKASLNITEESDEPKPSEEGDRGRGETPRQQYVSSSDRKKNAVFRYMYLALGLGAVGYSVYLGRNWENEEEAKKHTDAPSGWQLGLFWKRIQARLGSTMSYYRDPVTTKLLPDEDPDPNMRFPFTLVLSLEDMLVHSEWTREHGWRVAKRPGVDYFLRYLGSYYEIVLFTSQPMAVVEGLLRKLDPYSTIRWPLFREATVYQDGHHVKDLSYLNRDLKKVLIMDTDPNHVKNQPENAIILPKWKGDPNDQTLIQFIPFLEYLATMGFEDAREVLKSFEGKYIPAEFARREKLLREKFEKQEAEKKGHKSKKSLSSLGSFLGLSKPHEEESLGEGKMLWDQIRERGQRQYMEFDKKIKEEGEKWLAERDAEEKRMQEEAMKNMNLGGWFSGVLGSGDKPAEEKK